MLEHLFSQRDKDVTKSEVVGIALSIIEEVR